MLQSGALNFICVNQENCYKRLWNKEVLLCFVSIHEMNNDMKRCNKALQEYSFGFASVATIKIESCVPMAVPTGTGHNLAGAPKIADWTARCQHYVEGQAST